MLARFMLTRTSPLDVLYIEKEIFTFQCFNYFKRSLFDHIPVGVGSKGVIPMNAHDLEGNKNI